MWEELSGNIDGLASSKELGHIGTTVDRLARTLSRKMHIHRPRDLRAVTVHKSSVDNGQVLLMVLKTCAQVVFRSFDTNDNGTLDFKEYIIALHLTSTGKTARKLEWTFSLFDLDKNRYITKQELPNDDNTPEKRANKLWTFFEKKDNGEKNKVLFNVF
ncbi:visinin-like [Salvelinus alpinus]